MANQRIRQAAASNRVKLWEIAERYGVYDSTFSRKLRHELPENEQSHILGIIDNIASEREGR